MVGDTNSIFFFFFESLMNKLLAECKLIWVCTVSFTESAAYKHSTQPELMFVVTALGLLGIMYSALTCSHCPDSTAYRRSQISSGSQDYKGWQLKPAWRRIYTSSLEQDNTGRYSNLAHTLIVFQMIWITASITSLSLNCRNEMKWSKCNSKVDLNWIYPLPQYANLNIFHVGFKHQSVIKPRRAYFLIYTHLPL